MEPIFDGERRREWFKAMKLEMMPKKVFFLLTDVNISKVFHNRRKKYQNIIASDNKKNGFCLCWVLAGKMDMMAPKAKDKEKWQLKPVTDGGFWQHQTQREENQNQGLEEKKKPGYQEDPGLVHLSFLWMTHT